MRKYGHIKASSLESLDHAIELHMKDGYKPVGQLVVAVVPYKVESHCIPGLETEHDIQYIQAVKKED